MGKYVYQCCYRHILLTYNVCINYITFVGMRRKICVIFKDFFG